MKNTPGYKAYLVLNNDGVVIRWDQDGEQMPYEQAVQYSHHVLELCSKSNAQMKELFSHGSENNDVDDDEVVESIRVRTDCHEVIIAQQGSYTLVAIYVGQGSQKNLNDCDSSNGGTTKVVNS